MDCAQAIIDYLDSEIARLREENKELSKVMKERMLSGAHNSALDLDDRMNTNYDIIYHLQGMAGKLEEKHLE